MIRAADSAATSGTAADVEMLRALGVLTEAPDPAHGSVADALDLRGWRRAEATVFTLDLLPYAAIYVGPEGMLGGVAANRIAGFWRALGYDPPAEPDHLAALLGLHAVLTEAADAETDPARRLLRRQGCMALLWEHLLTWVPAYSAAVAAAGQPVHADWAALLIETLARQAAASGPPPGEFQHLRDMPPLPAPEDGVDALVRALLTPGCSGIILTRRDLARCARAVGAGQRVGERAFVLRGLLDQEPVAVLDWVGGEAGEWAGRHRAQVDVIGAAAGHWEQRARATRAALDLYRYDLQEVLAHDR